MRGAKHFKNAINNNRHISDALDSIPMDGMVRATDFHNYVETFCEAFPDGGDGVAVATRLLCMKRPDVFVCLDSKNRAALCREFGIRQTSVPYDRYFEEIIERVQDTEWWNSPRPWDVETQAIWEGRTALLDALYYGPNA